MTTTPEAAVERLRNIVEGERDHWRKEAARHKRSTYSECAERDFMRARVVQRILDKIDAALASSSVPSIPEGEKVEPSGWASPTLGRAYVEIERLRKNLAQPSESGIDEALCRALEAIETADCELAGVAS